MTLHTVDLIIIAVYLVATVQIGMSFRRRAMKKLDAYYLAEREVSWWMVGLSGCSSYVDIGGTMLIIGLWFYVGMQSVWILHVGWDSS